MAKGRTGMKDLGNIHQLFGQQQPEAPFAQQLAAHEAAPPPVEDIRESILGIMRNYRGWTVGDVQRVMKNHPDAAQIPTIMNKFANEGKFEISQTTGRANVYTLKRKPVETITSARNAAAAAAKPWAHRDPVGTRQAPDPKGVIKLEEGLDIAIWKIMSDGKYRTKNEICMMLAEYKFDRVQANRRVDSMINSRNYFDRREAGSKGMSYAQKKHLPMPALPNSEPMGAAFANTKENLSDTIVGKLSTPTFSGHLSHGHGAGGAADDSSLKAIDAVIAQERAEQNAAEHSTPVAAAPVTLVNEEPTMPLNPVIDHSHSMSEDDHLITLIWKAMSDFKPYKSEDVHVLVQMIRPAQSLKSVQNKLSALGIEGWFTIEKRGAANVYTLKAEIANPNLKLKDLLNAHHATLRANAAVSKKQAELPGVEAVAQTPEAQRADALVAEIIARRGEAQPAAQSNTQETEMTKASQAGAAPLVQVKAAPVTAAPVALLNTDIHIKGVAFTQKEADQLVDELTALGYSNTKVRQLSLVNQTVEIKGVEFTTRELVELTDGLLKEGFGKDNVRA